MGDVRHIIRAALLLGALLVGFLFARSKFVPESFGEYGHYRLDSVQEEMARIPLYQDSSSCGECHDQRYAQWKSAKHQSVECETCHGPARDHVTLLSGSPGRIEVKTSRSLCLMCHRELKARREGFPQVDVASHFDLFGLDPEDESATCIDCHDPHDPAM